MLKDKKIVNLEINGVLHTSIFAKQGDSARYLLFNLLDNGKPFSLVDRTVRVYAVKPDGTNVFNDLVITSEENGQAELQLTTQMLAIEGNVNMELVIYEGTGILSTIVFTLIVQATNRNDGAVTSTNEFSVLTNALADINAVLADNTPVKHITKGQKYVQLQLLIGNYNNNGDIQTMLGYVQSPFTAVANDLQFAVESGYVVPILFCNMGFGADAYGITQAALNGYLQDYIEIGTFNMQIGNVDTLSTTSKKVVDSINEIYTSITTELANIKNALE